MGFVAAIVLLIVSGVCIVSTFRRLRRTQASWIWWAAFGVLTITGLTGGSWIALNANYQVSPTMRFCSFPIPLAFLHLEDGDWVDFVTPLPVMYLGLAANVLSFGAVAVLPLLLASVAFQKKP